jgi:hypothetical protein
VNARSFRQSRVGARLVLDVERGGWLVQQQHRRLLGEDSREGHAATLTAREHRDRAVFERFQIEPFQGRFDGGEVA